MKKRVIFLLVLIASIQITYAHNPLSAMYYLEVKDDISILNINLSQTGLNEALKKQYSKIDLEQLTDTEYKQLTIGYLKENFQLVINGDNIALLEGGIKLGSHQTDVKFITTTLPKTFKDLNIEIKAFSENENHQTVFSLLLNGTTSKVILNQENNYTASRSFRDDVMVDHSNIFTTNYLWYLFLIPIILVGRKLMNKSN